MRTATVARYDAFVSIEQLSIWNIEAVWPRAQLSIFKEVKEKNVRTCIELFLTNMYDGRCWG